MRARCPDRRAVALLILALQLPGCVSGHLLAAARRREYAREIHAMTPVGADTSVAFTAEIVDEEGRSRGMVDRMLVLDGTRERVEMRELTRIRTAGWFYPALLAALVLDAIVTPAVVLLTPAPLLTGD